MVTRRNIKTWKTTWRLDYDQMPPFCMIFSYGDVVAAGVLFTYTDVKCFLVVSDGFGLYSMRFWCFELASQIVELWK